jgi:type IV secretory pathway VirJ component
VPGRRSAGVPARAALCVALALPLAQCALLDAARHAAVISYGRFEDLHVYLPEDAPRRLALVLSGDLGWSYRIGALARALASDGTLVVGVDVRALLSSLRQDPAPCVSPGADLAALAAQLAQR